MQIAGITERDVKQWHASLHATPFCADRSAPVLSVILRQAEVYGYPPGRVPTPVSVSGDTGGVAGNAFSRRKKCKGSAPY